MWRTVSFMVGKHQSMGSESLFPFFHVFTVLATITVAIKKIPTKFSDAAILCFLMIVLLLPYPKVCWVSCIQFRTDSATAAGRCEEWQKEANLACKNKHPFWNSASCVSSGSNLYFKFFLEAERKNYRRRRRLLYTTSNRCASSSPGEFANVYKWRILSQQEVRRNL